MKAVSLYKFTQDSQFNTKEMFKEERFEAFKFSPCGALDKSKMGFVTNVVSGNYVDEINVEGNTFFVVTCRIQKKQPEKYLVDDYVELKRVQYRVDTDKEPEKSLLKEWRQEGFDYYLRQTFPKKPVDFTIAVRKEGDLVFVEGKGNQAESNCALVRKALGTFPVTALETDVAVTDLLDEMVEKRINDTITLGDKVELVDQEDIKHSLTKGSVYSSDAAEYVKDGMMVTGLGLNYDGMLSFFLNEDLVFDALKFDKDLLGEDPTDAGSFIIKLTEVNKAVNHILGKLKKEEE